MRSALHCLLLFSALWTLSFCGTRQFHVVNVGKTWAKAQQYCRDEFTDLATIENQEEMDYMKAALNRAVGPFWIGLRQDPEQKTNRSWIWSDGSDSSYTYWNTGEPNNRGINNCVELKSTKNYQWNDAGCRHTHKFICYEEMFPLILIKEKKTWWEALKYCQSEHVDLVSVHTKEIQRWVETVSKTASTDNVWVGLRHTCDLKFWFWVSGEFLCYQNWAQRLEMKDCSNVERSGAVQFGSKQWISLPETETLNFICTTK